MSIAGFRRRLVFVLLVVAMLVTTSGALGALPARALVSPAPAAPAPEPTGPHLVLGEVTSWLDENGSLRVSGELRNPSEEALADPRLELRMSSSRLDSRAEINDWKTDSSAYRLLASSQRPPAEQSAAPNPDDDEDERIVPELPDTLAAGSTTEFSFEVPAADLELGTRSPLTSWGARGLAVRFVGQTDEGRVADTAAAFTTWDPATELDPTGITMIMPVTLPGFSPTGLLSPERLEESAADGELSSLLAAAEVDPSIALAVDPRLLVSIELALRDSDAESPEPTSTLPTSTEAPTDPQELIEEPAGDVDATPGLRAWFASFTELSQNRTVIALPWADADLVALREAGLDQLADRAEDESAVVADLLPGSRTDVSWPVSGTATSENLSQLIDDDSAAVILSDLQQPALTSYTSDAHSTIDLSPAGSPGAGPLVDSLVVDTGLSDAVAEAGDEPSRAASVSEYVAESSAITSERPYDARHLLVVLPRSGADGSWRRLAEATSSARWLEHRSLDELLETQPVSRSPIVTPTRQTGLTTDGVSQLAAAHERGSTFSAVFSEPAVARQDLARMIMSCTSATWAGSATFGECVGRATDEVDSLTSAIRPEEGSPVLLVTGERTTVPIRVENDTARPASVTVRVTPRTPQLRTQASEPVVLPAHESTRVDVPVEGLANGDVETIVEVVAADGYVAPQTGELLVRVRADWENIGTAVIGAGLLIVFVVGLVKSVSRGRRKIPQSQLDAAVARAQETDTP